MPGHGFSLIRVYPYKDRLEEYVLIRENKGQRKHSILANFTQYIVLEYIERNGSINTTQVKKMDSTRPELCSNSSIFTSNW